MILLDAKTKNPEKERLYHLQQGKCALCNLPLDTDINKNHLDHDHELHGQKAGRVRGLCCNLCNGLDGQVKHKFNRSGLVSKGVNQIEWLKSLIKYLEQDTTQNNFHPQFVPDRVKWFSRLNLTEMRLELDRQSIQYEISMGKVQLTKLYRKEFRKLLKANQCVL